MLELVWTKFQYTHVAEMGDLARLRENVEVCSGPHVQLRHIQGQILYVLRKKHPSACRHISVSDQGFGMEISQIFQ